MYIRLFLSAVKDLNSNSYVVRFIAQNDLAEKVFIVAKLRKFEDL